MEEAALCIAAYAASAEGALLLGFGVEVGSTCVAGAGFSTLACNAIHKSTKSAPLSPASTTDCGHQQSSASTGAWTGIVIEWRQRSTKTIVAWAVLNFV